MDGYWPGSFLRSMDRDEIEIPIFLILLVLVPFLHSMKTRQRGLEVNSNSAFPQLIRENNNLKRNMRFVCLKE